SGASSAADQRITLLAPAAHAAVHRQHVGVTHLPQVVGSEGRAEAAAAVQDDLGADVGDALLDVAFEDALAEVDRPRQVVPGVLALLADVDKAELLAAIEAGLDLLDRRFADALPGVLDQLQETRGMVCCHGGSPRAVVVSEGLCCP